MTPPRFHSQVCNYDHVQQPNRRLLIAARARFFAPLTGLMTNSLTKEKDPVSNPESSPVLFYL